jgi:choline kinase
VVKAYIMCAGNGKRFGGCKPIQPIQGKPNYLRTIQLLNQLGIEDVTISVPEDKQQLFEYDNKITGGNDREIDRFRNFKNLLTSSGIILYGDVVYHIKDLQTILSNSVTSQQTVFFGSRDANELTGKGDHEIKALFVHDAPEFYNAVDVVANKFETGKIKREIGWEVYRELRNNTVFVDLSDYTDDFDTPDDYRILARIYNNF